VLLEIINLMASSSAAQVQEALALLQKTSSTDGGSLYDQLTKLIVKVLHDSHFHFRCTCHM
jgi:hypothetical protein